MAKAALNRGAVGVRLDTPAHIRGVRQQTDAPIIGLWKQTLPGYEVYITPRWSDALAVVEAGADIVALDATQRDRPEDLAGLITRIHGAGKLVMADVDTPAAAIAATQAGADLVGTTLYGYTPSTQNQTPPGFDLLAALVRLPVPAICEGGIASVPMARQALELGAYAVVVGTAITGIDLQVQAYVKGISGMY
jgi:N-acylglucosamine-6-phosphate 2-epimerase